MKKIFIISVASLLAITNASAILPLPQVVPDAQPGGRFVTARRALEDLRRQELENQMLQEQIAMMQQQDAAMEMQPAAQYSEISEEEAAATQKNGRLGSGILQLIGSSYEMKKGKLIIVVNQDKIISMIPQAINYGIYSEGSTEQALKTHPTLASEVNALVAIMAILTDVYTYNAIVDKINVQVYLEHPDIYGNEKKDLFFKFSVNRDLYNKINWRKVDLHNAPAIFPRFKFSEWRKKAIAAELNLS